MKKHIAIITFIIITIAFIFVAFDMSKLPSSYNGVAKVIVDETISKTRAINSVTAIVFDFRGYDTLGESIVLLTAVCGTTAVLRRNKGGMKNEKQKK